MHWDERIGRRLKLRDLHVLEAAAQVGSLAKAAKSLGMSQPAVSYSIAEMEKQLGVSLLDRTPLGVTLTAYGQVLLERSVVAFNELRRGITEIEAMTDPAAGELRIGTPQPMLPVMSGIIDELSRRYPRMSVHLSVESTHVLLRELRQRSIELVVSRMHVPLAEDDVCFDILFHDQLAVIAGKSNPLVRRTAIKLSQLVNEPWVLPPPDGWLHPLLQKAFAGHGLNVPRATVSTLSTYAVSMLVANGRFLTVHPETMLRLPDAHPSLRALPVALTDTRTPVGVISLKNHSLSPAARQFVESMRGRIKALFGKQAAGRR